MDTSGGCGDLLKINDIFPSPEETDHMVWINLNEAISCKRSAGINDLNNFIKDIAQPYVTQKNDAKTNIIDQGTKITYSLPPDNMQQLFAHIEQCRLEGTPLHFSERQGTIETPNTGIMLDFDIITTEKKPIITDRQYYKITTSLITMLQKDINFSTSQQSELPIHVFFIIKPNGIAKDQHYKYGIHILIPGIRLSRPYKKWLCRHFSTDPVMISVLKEWGAVGDLNLCLDQNSASVPVLFFGCCKRGAVPYVLGAAISVILDTTSTGMPLVISKIDEKTLSVYNLTAELSLVYEAKYNDNMAPLVNKMDFSPRDEIEANITDWGDRTQNNIISDEELMLAENSLSTLTLHNPEARHLHALLNILNPEYYEVRDKWRDVIFALANTSEQYKPLAIWFSQKCPQKWNDGGLFALDSIWDEACIRRGSVERPLTVASIKHWAKTCNPTKYKEIMERSYFTTLTSYIYENEGKLQHFMIAKVLHSMLNSLFCVDTETGSKYCWYQFVLPGQTMKSGEIWKWRKEIDPDDIQIYISDKLTKVIDQILEHLEDKKTHAKDESQAKYYLKLSKAVMSSKQSLYHDTFKNGVIRQANYLFRRRGFADQLDKVPFLFGVANGVLKLGPRITLIDHYHEHPISRYTPVYWKKFDPNDPYTKIALDAIANIFIEPDARDWILFQAAQGLSSDQKEGIILLIDGGGQNGKSTFLRCVAKALGPYAAKFNIQLMCCEREEADKPNSAVMRFEYLNYAYCEETNKSQTLNVARMKEMVNAGEISGRDLNSKQKEFTMRANFVAASQYSFIVDTTDHGTWRRIRHYTSKAKFRKNPDPNDPYEKQEDQKFILHYPNDPQFLSSILSILCHYYERLQNEYNGELKNVRSETIERETEIFRVSQDALHRWISTTIVVSPSSDCEYPLSILGGYYTDWYSSHVDRKRHAAGEIIKEIEGSILNKYLKPALNRTKVLKGCRVLTSDDNALRPDEEFIHVAESRNKLYDKKGDTTTQHKKNWWDAAEPLTLNNNNKREILDDELFLGKKPVAADNVAADIVDDIEFDKLFEDEVDELSILYEE